ncbi:MAG: NAD-dependent epimerase/dehydratase family protein [Nanoarchaeota archaeon]
MRCLVTGGTGFIGSNLAKELKKQGNDVIITGHQLEQDVPGIKCIYPTFTNLKWEKLGKLDVVFHQAAITDTRILDKEEMFNVNVEASKELFRQVVKYGCKRIVYASSTASYGNEPAPYVEGKTKQNPLNPYGESKKLLDEFALKFAKEHPDVIIVGLRYCNVYGPGESHKGKMRCYPTQVAEQMVKGNPKLFKHGEQKRDYIYVKDVVRANILASKAKQSCIVNCGSGKATTFNEIVEILNKVMRLNRKPEYIENPFVGKYQDYTLCDMSLAKELLGFVPEYDIEKGIKDYYDSGHLVPKQ